MKKTGCWLLAVFLTVGLMSGCSGSQQKEHEMTAPDEKLKVVTTLFPYYDFVRQIAGDKVDLVMVVPAGMDSHSFEPTPADMKTIQNADVLVCNGGEMEHWLEQVLDAMDRRDTGVVSMMDYVDTVETVEVEGMEDAHNHSHDHEGEEHDHEYDEHIWTSPKNAMQMVTIICDALSAADMGNQEYYKENAKQYLERLEELDAKLWAVAEDGQRNVIVIADKFPFRYLTDAYGWDYFAAFSGCSTDTEPSAKTIAFLIDKMKLEKIPVIYYLELSSHRIAEVIEEETGATPLLLHSCHNVTRAEFDGGVTYLELMEQNVENLRKGLNE